MTLEIKEINKKYDLNFDNEYIELYSIIVEIFNSNFIIVSLD
jgi:hypothetical protein